METAEFLKRWVEKIYPSEEAFLGALKSKKLVIYHGKTESIYKQLVVEDAVYRQMDLYFKATKKYIFEPSADEVLEFLQHQFWVNTIHLKIFEAQSARLSARRWNWTKQQMARSRLLEELRLEFVKYKKSVLQKQQQVTLSAHRLGVQEIE